MCVYYWGGKRQRLLWRGKEEWFENGGSTLLGLRQVLTGLIELGVLNRLVCFLVR